MANHGTQNSQPQFSFQNFFQEAQKDLPFHQRPEPNTAALRMERKASNVGPDGSLARENHEDQPMWKRLPAWVYIIAWIATSSAVILQNAHILSDLKFRHPVALTTIHLAFQTLATRLLRRYTNMVDKAKELEATGTMNRDSFLRKIVPVGLLFSASLVLSNWVYLRLSVSFIQMIKAFTPVSVLLVSASFGLKELTRKILLIVSLISFGVALASYGEVEFELIGFLVQALAIGIESCRLVLVQKLLQGFGLDPIASLYYLAPVCLVVNAIILLPVEGFEVFSNAVELVGIPYLLMNACLTFALNLASVSLIGKASGLVLTLSGVLKDILLIAGSWALMGSTITGIQILGYAIALAGLVWFKQQ
ncbi:hypothetical protein NBRC10512_003092 [Rhodotorula toruloides]|uniref:RHTO0S05e10528g1_1 n=2 Tax=Rhodotorula toruloides TaxID=5286 RepID=A0A061ATY7_RHOTO|nr:DUF250 domain membrane protein [Rhodotorula toruloides NP11]EMS23686.1 DUF250 domain membrane protein [Rhodotorula toruloides NP11]CDR40992.1 RHTO0S05e10528g1_1 [Rhodotorula toruloides]